MEAGSTSLRFKVFIPNLRAPVTDLYQSPLGFVTFPTCFGEAKADYGRRKKRSQSWGELSVQLLRFRKASTGGASIKGAAEQCSAESRISETLRLFVKCRCARPPAAARGRWGGNQFAFKHRATIKPQGGDEVGGVVHHVGVAIQGLRIPDRPGQGSGVSPRLFRGDEASPPARRHREPDHLARFGDYLSLQFSLLVAQILLNDAVLEYLFSRWDPTG